MGFPTILLRLSLASVLGCLIGLERHRADKSAGMRTHMLVSLGSALIMIVSAYGFDDIIRPSRIVLDPSRIAAQVVSGIGFLGAGMILRRQSEVYGLTTAAGVWASAGIGLAAGCGLYFAACASTGFVLISLLAIKPIEDRLSGAGTHFVLNIVTTNDAIPLPSIEAILKDVDVELKDLRVRKREGLGEQQLTLRVSRADQRKLLAVVERLHAEASVKEVSFERHDHA
jgi:putative Mg2+ transporter-C (MgtC) family protein